MKAWAGKKVWAKINKRERERQLLLPVVIEAGKLRWLLQHLQLKSVRATCGRERVIQPIRFMLGNIRHRLGSNPVTSLAQR